MMVKITHVVPTINKEASGPSYSVTRLCRGLNEINYPTKLAVLESLPNKETPSFVKGFPYSWGPKKIGVSTKMRDWLNDEARSGGFQLIHSHSLWMMPNLYPVSSVMGTGCKLVVSPRGTLAKKALERSSVLKRILRKFLVDPVLDGAVAFHATSDQEYRDIRAQGASQPVAILPNGIDLPEIKQTSKGSLKRLLFLGRIHPIKGIDNLLQAWSVVQDKFTDWELVIAGPDNGGYLEELKKLAKSLSLDRCQFTRALYGDEKQKAYMQADLYILPTHTENFGMTVAESLAAGTPVITTKGAPWEGLEKEGAGWWVDIGVEPLVFALEEALSLSRETLEKKGLRGRSWMKRDFSWEIIAKDMAKFYDWIILGGEKPFFVRVD